MLLDMAQQALWLSRLLLAASALLYARCIPCQQLCVTCHSAVLEAPTGRVWRLSQRKLVAFIYVFVFAVLLDGCWNT